MSTRQRQLVVLRGTAGETRAAAQRLVSALANEAVAWLGADQRGGPAALGQGFDAVVIDAHGGLDPDLLGQAHGLVFGGGALIVRMSSDGEDAELRERLAAYPYTLADVGRRCSSHAERVLARLSNPSPTVLAPTNRDTRGTAEQAACVARLVARWTEAPVSRAVVLADRGRGKSSALGLALAQLAERERVITGPNEAAVAEVRRFAGPDVEFVPLLELIAAPERQAVIVVDEAAQLPVPLLQRLVLAHPRSDLAFATTTHGYEGTGRGFSLRFLTWLDRVVAHPVERLELHEPIRWGPDDALERAVFEALLLDAEPAVVEQSDLSAGAALGAAELELVTLDRDALANDLPRLRELFGLLVHAHYRTSPGDLQRLLDAPNLEVHAALLEGHVVAASLVAEEGGLPPELCQAAHSGNVRLRAHALADVLIAHLGQPEAGELRMRRSVRIAVHPAVRRRGLARALVEHVHAAHPDVDLFGTLFGATAELVEFRRRLGYSLVRVSASRGARTGEPSLLMVRPVTPAARALIERLRIELARELDVQLELLATDDGLTLEPALIDALRAELPTVEPYTPQQCRAAAEAYAHGPRTFESVATAIRGFVGASQLDALTPELRAVVVGRALDLHGWQRVTQDAGLASVTATMRALRRAIRTLLGV